MLATAWLDVLFVPLYIVGIERIEPAPGTGGTGYGEGVIYADYTHSLVGALALGLLFGLIAAVPWGRRTGAVLGAVVFSHWVLDLLVHRGDMAILPGNLGDLPRLGFGLWQIPLAAAAAELAFVAIRAVLYGRAAARRAGPAARGRGRPAADRGLEEERGEVVGSRPFAAVLGVDEVRRAVFDEDVVLDAVAMHEVAGRECDLAQTARQRPDAIEDHRRRRQRLEACLHCGVRLEDDAPDVTRPVASAIGREPGLEPVVPRDEREIRVSGGRGPRARDELLDHVLVAIGDYPVGDPSGCAPAGGPRAPDQLGRVLELGRVPRRSPLEDRARALAFAKLVSPAVVPAWQLAHELPGRSLALVQQVDKAREVGLSRSQRRIAQRRRTRRPPGRARTPRTTPRR